MDTRAEAEADRLLTMHGGRLADALRTLADQFTVLQTRTQLLLTLATLTLTITGFSGPLIAKSGAGPRWCLVAGLVLVLVAVVMLLLGTLRIRWLTQFDGADPRATLVAAIAWRDAKTRHYLAQLGVLVAGLSAYVGAVVWFLVIG
jgi:hypothetical protein